MPDATVFVVDDDDGARDSLRMLLEAAGYTVHAHETAEAFLADPVVARGGAVLADVRMPGMSGVELQEELIRRNLGLPVIIITGHADVPVAVRAMKAGAIDFMEKPFDSVVLLESVKRALETAKHVRAKASDIKVAQDALALLTAREREVLEHLIAGESNKVAAKQLGISPRTVEIHRAHLMEKLRARNLSDLVRVALAAGVQVMPGR